MTATQAPTPGPLDSESVKLLVKLLDTLKPFAEVAENLKHCHVVEICEPTPDNPSRNIIPMPREWFERAGDDLEYIAIQLHASGVLSEGQASKITGLDRVSVRREVDRLAPTAPVEASGSVGLAASEIGEHIAKRDAEYESALADLTITPDASSLDEFGRSIFGALSDCPAMSIDKQADFVARALWPAVSALRPQPSGETREAGLDVFGDEVTDVQSRYIIVHQLRASADIQDEEIKRETGWATTTDRASLMRKAANTIERLALLSARPLALGGQHSTPTDFPPDDVLACVTTPARAEAQDEGAAGEIVGDGMPIGEGFLYRTTMTGERHIVHEATGFTIAKLPYDYRYTDNATQKALADKIVALYAHPSPTPAADADRVRIAVEALEKADAAARSGAAMSAADYSISAERLGEEIYKITTPALAALKSEGK